MTRTVLAGALGAALLVSGCGGDETGPLTLDGPSFVADPQQHGIWFSLRGCLRDGDDAPPDVMITDVVATHVEGGPVETPAAWQPPRAARDVLGVPGEPPAAYRAVTSDSHVGGTLTGCALGVAVVLPPASDRKVSVRGLDVTYEADGHTYTAHSPVDVTLCPAGTSSREHGCR